MNRVSNSSHDRLGSWKEIAAYLKRGVRTVRRWEREEGLPVHRHMHRALGSVYAYKSEIDSWRRTGERRGVPPASDHTRPASATPATSIAVLPFTNLSTDPDNEYFADGLTDEVIADLSKVRALRVISRTSSMVFKGTNKDVKTIARELGIQHVVEGTVRRAGDRLRVTAQLIDASADDHLWTDKYDGTVEDVFAIQERVARMIVDALKLRLTSEEDRRLSSRPIGNVHAYECYLQARQEAFRWRRDAIDHAVQLLHNGLGIVGENAELLAALGRAHLQYREAGIDFGQRPLDEAEACVRKVFALDRQSASGWQLRGTIRYSRGQIQDAVRDLKAALEVDPGNPDTLALLSNCYLISGKVSVARPLIDRLMAVDPLTPLTRCMPGWADVLEGDFAAAVGPYRQMFEMDPGNPMGRLFYVSVLIDNRRQAEVNEIVATLPLQMRDTLPGRLTLFLAHAFAGNRHGALAAVTPEVEAAANGTDVFPRILAQGYALAGIPERAIDWLGIAVDRGFVNYPFLAQHDPSFESLRSHPRFQQLLEIVRGRWERFEV
jgi:TolB-like protein/thioredoxin-like negative regulator of GroEL